MHAYMHVFSQQTKILTTLLNSKLSYSSLQKGMII
jgi:hypothetical protein